MDDKIPPWDPDDPSMAGSSGSFRVVAHPSGGHQEAAGSRSPTSRTEYAHPPKPGDPAPLVTMDGTVRALCERIRDRLGELSGARSTLAPSSRRTPHETEIRLVAPRAGSGRPRRDVELDAALSQVEYDLNGAEFLLRELRAALAVSTTRDIPPVAAYRASLEGSRRALHAIREASNVPQPRASPSSPSAPPPRGIWTPREGGAGHALKGIWSGTVSFVKGLLDDPFLDPLIPPALASLSPDARSRRGEIPGDEAMRDAPEDSENYHVSAGYYPPERRRRRKGERDGERGAASRRGSRRGRGGRSRGVPPGMSPVIEESSPQKDSRVTSPARDKETVTTETGASAGAWEGASVGASASALAERVRAQRLSSTPPRPSPRADSEVDVESLYGGADSVWEEGETMWRNAATEEQSWVRALHGAGGGVVGAGGATRRSPPTESSPRSPRRSPKRPSPRGSPLRPSKARAAAPPPTVREEPEGEAAYPPSRSPVEFVSRAFDRSDASEVSTEDDRYDELIGMYANVKPDDLPRVTVADMSPGITPDITPVKGSNDRPRPFASAFAREEGDEEEYEAADANEAARGELFATSNGGDARAVGSSSWAPDKSYDPVTAGRHAKRTEAQIKEELARGVGRLEKSSEVLSEASHRAVEANTQGENLLAALRGQRETLVRSGDALLRVGSNMGKNEKLVSDMNSWTRLGAKSRRTPWG